jgi:hypothetical protein
MLTTFHIRFLLALALLGPGTLFAQSCPPSDGKSMDAPQPSVLHGTIKYHPVTRPWMGLVLPQPVCGASEIELAFSTSEMWRHTKQMNRCPVTIKGMITESPTAYYSADLNIFNGTITPDPNCKVLPTDPDYSKMSIPDSIKSYEVTVFIDIRGNRLLRGEVSASGQRLEPWQPYVQWFLNGEKDLDLSCRKGFKLVSFKSRGSRSELFDPNAARLDVNEDAPASLTIECRRDK